MLIHSVKGSWFPSRIDRKERCSSNLPPRRRGRDGGTEGYRERETEGEREKERGRGRGREGRRREGRAGR